VGRRCLVCSHPERARIELALSRRVGYREIAKRYPELNKDNLFRHKKNHLPPQVEAALRATGRPTDIDLDALRQSESEGLLQHLVAQRGRLNYLLDLAEEVKDVRGASSIHGRITDNLALTGRLLGEITAGSRTTVNQLVISPEYLTLRQQLIEALRPFPDARAAVARVLRDLEGGAPAITFTGSPARMQVGADGRA
jgi:hypothetical protein